MQNLLISSHKKSHFLFLIILLSTYISVSPVTDFKRKKKLVLSIMNHLITNKAYGKRFYIWSLESPNKVKHFIWRACKNSLPTKCNLVRRQVISDHSCDRCSGSPENPLHPVRNCPELDCVLGASKAWDFRAQVAFQNFSELMAWIIKNDKCPELFSMIVWCISTQRNQIRTQ